jgi:hypothetical protein
MGFDVRDRVRLGHVEASIRPGGGTRQRKL